MSPLLLIAGLAAIALLLSGGKSGASRELTRADMPKLRELALVKAAISRDIGLCHSQAIDNRLLSPNEAMGGAIGFVAGVGTGSFGTALKAARGATDVLNGINPSKVPAVCKGIAALVARNDDVSKGLGLPPDLDVSAIYEIIGKLGGIDYAPDKARAYENCVKQYGKAGCDRRMAAANERD